MIWKTTNGLNQEVTWYDQQELNKIKDIASINAINTCWASLTLCDECEEKQEADIQCPFIKFKMILEIIEGLANGRETS